MRSPAATRLLALPRFFRFFTGLPPLVGLCGASVMCETNCFSVGNMLKSVPYSLITNCTVSTPMASIPVTDREPVRLSPDLDLVDRTALGIDAIDNIVEAAGEPQVSPVGADIAHVGAAAAGDRPVLNDLAACEIEHPDAARTRTLA